MTKDSYESFERYMKKKEDKKRKKDKGKSPPPTTEGCSIGGKDSKGNLLILSGWKASIWELKNGVFKVGEDTCLTPQLAIRTYNSLNSTKLSEDYIDTYFRPWYSKQTEILIEIPSSRDIGTKYRIRREPGGILTCECPGFRFRGTCWHVKAAKDIMKEMGDKE